MPGISITIRELLAVLENKVDGSSMIGFPHVIADYERHMPRFKPGPLGWYTSALTNGYKSEALVIQFKN